MINVTLGETFVLRLDATDADGDPLTFDVPNLPPNAMFNSTGNILYFSWNVTSADEVLMHFILFSFILSSTSCTLIKYHYHQIYGNCMLQRVLCKQHIPVTGYPLWRPRIKNRHARCVHASTLMPYI